MSTSDDTTRSSIETVVRRLRLAAQGEYGGGPDLRLLCASAASLMDPDNFEVPPGAFNAALAAYDRSSLSHGNPLASARSLRAAVAAYAAYVERQEAFAPTPPVNGYDATRDTIPEGANPVPVRRSP